MTPPAQHPRRGEPAAPWATGKTSFFVDHRQGPHQLILAVPCRLVGLANIELGMLDTGAQRSMIGGELAEIVGPHASDLGWSVPIATRLGKVRGAAHRLEIDLVAEAGDDLRVSATVMLAPDWSGPPVVLGFHGLLERIRLALDPGETAGEEWLYFGSAGSATQ